MDNPIFSTRVSLNGKFMTGQLFKNGEVFLLDTEQNLYITHTLNSRQLTGLKSHLITRAKSCGAL